MPLKCHLRGNCSTWNVIVLHRRSPDFNPAQLLQSTISNFVAKKVSGDPISTRACSVNEAPVRIVLPFKDQRSANFARRQLGEIGRKIEIDIRPVYTSRKIGHEIKPKEKKPLIINQQRVVGLLLQIWFVRCKLYRVYVPTPVSARRGTQRTVFNWELH